MFLLNLRCLLCCWLQLAKPADFARILSIFPIEVKSHFYFHEAMMMSLVEADHHVTMVSPYPVSHPHRNLTIINSKFERNNHISQIKTATRAGSSWYSNLLNGLMNVFEPDCRHVMAMEEIQNLENFDIIFLELMPLYECYFPLAKKLQIPIVGTIPSRSLAPSDQSVGNSRNPATFPIEFTLIGSKMSFSERLFNLVEDVQHRVHDYIVNKQLEKFYKELFSDQSPQNSFISLLFSNSHEIFLPRTTVSNAIDIGGIAVKTATEGLLPEHLRKFINESTHGVILFSLGTLTNSYTLPPEVITALKNTFAKIPQRVIWKHDDDIDGISDNVLLSSWLPQKEILAHGNVLAFMSHCGISSTYEAIYYGKPMIFLPLFNDQTGNAGILKSLETGIYLNLLQLNEIELLTAIQEVTENLKYQRNMKALSKQFKDEPKSPSENVVYWTEYILRHKGAKHLRWVGADMSSYQYFLFEITGFILTTTVSVIFFFLFSIKCTSFLVAGICQTKFDTLLIRKKTDTIRFTLNNMISIGGKRAYLCLLSYLQVLRNVIDGFHSDSLLQYYF